MKKFLKFIFVCFLILFGIFIIWCFIPEDEETADSGYSESGYWVNESDTDNSSNGGNTITNGTSSSISSADTASKQELIESGIVRETQVQLKGNGEDTVTILLYMNGSDLESDGQEATADLSEMVAAGSSDKVNLIVQTMGTKKWSKKFGIASDRSQRYKVDGNGLTLIEDNLGQLDCTISSTLADFVSWGTSKYPADRYILLFWNHGGGPIYGFGYDEWNSDEEACLSVDEMQAALKKAGIYFDFIGMDCCIMSCLEVGCALYDYCDYLILSEDFESGMGWEYTKWLKTLYSNSSISTPELGQLICDEMVNANISDTSNGDESIMSLIDVSMMKVLYTAWKDFAYANQDTLLNTNYSKTIKKKAGGRILPSIVKHNNEQRGMGDYGYFYPYYEDDASLSDYYITDIMAVAQNIDSDESAALSAAVNSSLLYVRSTSGNASLTGISVTLPYGDQSFYSNLKKVFTNIGFDNDYVDWLKNFTSVSNSTELYDYSDWEDSWYGWDYYDDDYNWDCWDYYDDEEYWQEDFGWDDFDYSHEYFHDDYGYGDEPSFFWW